MAMQTPIQERYQVRMIQLAELKGGGKVKRRRRLFWTSITFFICGTLLVAPWCIEVLR